MLGTVRPARRTPALARRWCRPRRPGGRPPGELHQPRVCLGHRELLRLRRLVRLLAGDAGVQDERRDQDAADISPTRSSGVSGRPALGISALPGGRRRRSAGPRAAIAVQVGVADRAPVLGGSRPGRRRAGSSPATAASARPGAARRPAAGRRRAARSTSPGSGAGPEPSGRRSSTTHEPSSSWVETCSAQVSPGARHPRRQRRAGVDHEQVAGLQPRAGRATRCARPARRHHGQPDLVPGQTAGLRR